jgi:hypothetical protein
MFWDSSAVVPFLVPEARSRDIASWLRSDHDVVLWWASVVECQSALYRRHREAPLPRAALTQALARLTAVAQDADVVAPTNRVRERAGRLLATHPMRAADALQLAAALVWCDEQPQGQVFVTLDERLAETARREGFGILPE